MNTTEILPCKNPLVAATLKQSTAAIEAKIDDVAVEFTWRCFQECRLCYGRHGVSLPEMDMDQVVRLKDNLKDAGVTTAHGTGGEILWHKNAVQIFETFGREGFKQEIDTNGTLIDPSMADVLAQHHVEVAVGLESLDPQVYHWYRGTDQLPAVLRGIDLIQKRGMTPMIQSVVANFKGYPGQYSPLNNTLNLIETMTGQGVPVVLIQHHTAGRALDNSSRVVDLTLKEKQELADHINTLPEKKRKLVFGDIKFQRYFKNVPPSLDCAGCLGGVIRANIDVHGQVYMCNWRREQSFGNAFTENFTDISQRMIDYRKQKLEQTAMCSQTACEFKQRRQCWGPCLMAKITDKQVIY